MVVLIAASLLFIVASAGTLVWGWLNGQQTLIWTSIACSVLAGVLLLVAHLKTRRKPAVDVLGSTERAGTSTETRAAGLKSRFRRPRSAPATKTETPAAPSVATASRAPSSVAAATAGAVEPEPVAIPAAATTTRSRTPAKPEPGPAPAKRAASSKRSASSDTQVVAVAERKKFHRPDCRYAKSKGAETMSKANARRRGLAPCGICKP